MSVIIYETFPLCQRMPTLFLLIENLKERLSLCYFNLYNGSEK
jgi:hypothetical protein